MPLERPNHYGHFLTDGTDISRMPVDQIEQAQRKADQAFFEKGRSRSPRFRSFEEMTERRHQRNEARVARLGLVVFVLGLLAALMYDAQAAWFSIGGLALFVATCFYSGNRQYNRSGDIGHGRPF